MSDDRPVCPDCRCYLTTHNHSGGYNMSRYCNPCLRERITAGEQVPAGSYVDHNDRERHVFHVVCSRCSGTGFYLVSATQDGTDCFRCHGTGFLGPDREEVQQTARWWETFQANRVAPKTKRGVRS